MSERLYKPGDLVVLGHSETSPMFNGKAVIITKAERIGDTWAYEFVIPESRGSVPQQLISHRVAEHMKVPAYQQTEWVQP